MRSREMERQARREKLKFACMAGAILLIWGTIITGLAYGTNVTGVTSTAVTGNVVVGGDVIYKGGIGGVPSGSILMFTTACPTGWTRQTVFDSIYVRIATSPNATGGASSHSHSFNHNHDSSFGTLSGGSSHAHSDDGATGLSTAGSHGHSPPCGDLHCGGGGYGFWQSTPTANDGSHSHTFNYGTSSATYSHTHSSSGTVGYDDPGSGSANNDPTRISVVLCKKN